jgi:hypothetical protein
VHDPHTSTDATPGEDAFAGRAGVLDPIDVGEGCDNELLAADRDDRDRRAPDPAAPPPGDRQEVCEPTFTPRRSAAMLRLTIKRGGGLAHPP